MSTYNVAMLTSGGLAPCLSSAVAHLIHYWNEALKNGKIANLTIRMYRDGYKGLLTGDSFLVPQEIWEDCAVLQDLGGSPIGNSRVKVNMQLLVYVLIFCFQKILIVIYGDPTRASLADQYKRLLSSWIHS